MLELLIDNKDGNVWDVSNIVTDITWKTTRIGKPASLDFTLIKDSPFQSKTFQYNNGDIVRFRKDGQNIFYGYIFSIDAGKEEDVRIKAYDQVRYLLANDTYVFSNVTASQVVQQIAVDFNLQIGRMEDTQYRIPTMVEDGKKLLDIITKALDLTLINTNLNFVFYDDFGSLTIRNVENMMIDFMVGDQSLMYEYRFKRDIDQDTYNKIKIYQDNKDTGKREVYLAKDSANIARWGVLQLYQSADENLNSAQINELLNTLMMIKNREKKTLKIDAIGDTRVRAGCYVPIAIDKYNINQPFLVDACTHRFNGGEHTMSLELRVI